MLLLLDRRGDARKRLLKVHRLHSVLSVPGTKEPVFVAEGELRTERAGQRDRF
jgi:hypothetical protein